MLHESKYNLNIVSWLKAYSRIKAFVRNNQIDLIYCNGARTAQLGYYVARSCGLPQIVHVHSAHARRYTYFYRLHHAPYVIFVSEANRQRLLEKVSFSGNNLVIYNGVNTEYFSPPIKRETSIRAKLGIPEEAVVIGQVGSLISRKGGDVLIEAINLLVKQNLPVCLVLVGEGEQKTNYQSKVKELGLESKVSFLGHQDNTLQFYQHVFDINVLASRSEAMGLTILEGASCGLPTVGANVEGIPEAIEDSITGFVFEKENAEELAQKLRLLVSDAARRVTMGVAAREMIKQKFSEEQYVQSITEVISKAIKGV
jgi:glycosyltransferase involved in cell wall biosynthesis